MIKNIITAGVFLLLTYCGFAQIPSGYYNAAANKTGEQLRAALRNIITAGSVKLPYTSSSFDVWDAYSVTDTRPGNSNQIWDMYSDIPGGTPSYIYTIFNDQCGTSGAEGDCYSREHQVPNSWWGGFDDANNPQYTDLHHLPPSDQYVNSRKSAHPIGITSTATWTSTNGSKVGPCSWPGYTGTVFEPIDEYKGDFARAYLYIATRYMNSLSAWVNDYPGTEAAAIIHDTSNNYKQWFIDMLVNWTITDPVSQKEIDRNNAIYYNTPQHNRNPYIDHPEYVCIVWSSSGCSAGPLVSNVTHNPAYPNSIQTVTVTATITSTTALANILLVYGNDGINFPDTIPMNLVSGSTYISGSAIPAFPDGTNIFYKVLATDIFANTGSSAINNYAILKNEPADYPTFAACSNTSASTITLTWVDASGTVPPDGYLVKMNSTGLASITDPVDGIPEPDGSFVKNISQGTQGVTFSGLASSTTYYFKIFPYTNSGTVINYKVSAGYPTTSCSTSASAGGGCAPDLIISEYVEGSSNNKYIEIANYTGSAVNLGNYRLRLFSNGSATATTDVLLSGTINNQSTIVYRNNAATVYTGTSTTNGAVNFNGDDAIALYKVSTASYVDIFGRIGEDPGTAWTSGAVTTLDKTLVRNSNITSGVTVNPASGFPSLATEWTQYNQDVVTNLGAHNMACNFCATPSIAAASVTMNAINETSMTISWVNGNGNKRLVVMKQGSAVSAQPSNNTTYMSGNIFGSGDFLQPDEYVVYNDAGTSVTVSNLLAGQVYYVSVFEYSCVTGSELYLVPGSVSFGSTYSIVTGTVPESQFCITSVTGYTTSIDIVSTGNFSSNTYTVLLSDANGDFNGAQQIGSVVSNANVLSINCSIPANTPSGTGYKMQVVSSNPAISGSESNAFEIILSSVALDPTGAQTDRSGFCAEDAGNITLTASGGSGAVLSWFSNSCGGTYVGSGNPLIIASPSETTTYYARWGTACSNSGCVSVTVTVSGLPQASAGAAISSCSGMSPIVMTGATASGSGNTWTGGEALGTWQQHADPALAVFTPSVTAGSFVSTLTVTGTGSCPGASAASTRVISWGTAGSWTGAVSTNWFASGNWCGGVPLSTTSITIPPASQVLFSPTIGASNARCLNMNLSGLISIANGYNLDVYGNWVTNGGAFSSNSGFVTLRGAAKTVSGTSSVTFPGLVINTGASYTMNTSNNCASISIPQGSAASLTISNAALSVNGNVTISNPSSGGTSSLNINNSSVTISGNVTVGSGTSQGSRIARVNVNASTLTITGNLAYNVGNVSSAVVDLSAGSTVMNIGGNISLSNAGTLSPGTSSLVNFNGSASGQTVTFGSGITYNSVAFNNSSVAGVSIASNITTTNVTGNISVQSGIFSNAGFTVTGNASKQFSVSNLASYRLSGNTAVPAGFGTISFATNSTVEFRGTQSQTIGAYNYGNLISSSSGARVLASSGTIGIAGVFTPGTNNYTIAGSTVRFNGSNQAVPGFNGSTGYNNLAIAQVSGNAVTTGNITVGGTLNLVSGSLHIAGNILTLSGTAAIGGSPFSAAKMIIADGGGELRKIFTNNASYLFPVGDNSNVADYSPVTISYTSGSYAVGAYASVKVANLKHPANTNTGNYLNRYWVIGNAGISNPLYSIDAVYNQQDVVGNDTEISMGKYTGSIPWIKYGAANIVTKTISATNINDNGAIAITGISTFTGLQLTVLLEGFYNGNNAMRANLFDLGISNNLLETDTIVVNLWSVTSLLHSQPDYTVKTILHTDGTASMQLPGAVNGNSYYIAVKHRNHLETWSRLPVLFQDSTDYDFTTSLLKAYDDGVNAPMTLVDAGKYALYGGDVNQDGTVDASDMADVDNDISLFAFGYHITDVNGDGATDASDISVIDNNQALFLFYARPY